MPGICWQFVIFAAGPWVGALMDSMPRVVAFKALCIVQVANLMDSSYVDRKGLD